MDNGCIFSKTGKGSLEITKKTIKLSSEERQALILVDGKTNFGELQEKLARIPPPKLRAVFDKLASLELIREFVARAAPASAMAASETSSAPSVAALEADAELDFTALMSPASAKAFAPVAALDFSELAPASNTSSPASKPAAAGASATNTAEEARKFQEMMFGGGQADQAAQAAKQAEAAAALRKAEAARKVAEDQARRKAEAERIAREEAARKADAERVALEEAARKAAEEETRRKAAEQAERERIEREAREREEAARRSAEEDTRHKAEAERIAREEAARKADAERVALEEAARKAAEEETRRKAEAAQRAATAAEQQHKADQEVAQYVAALTPQIDAVSAAPPPRQPASLDYDAEAKAAFDADLSFAPKSEEEQRKSEVDRLMMGAPAEAPLDGSNPLTGSGPDTFADLAGNTVDPQADNPDTSRKALESASRKEIERDAKERAKADAKAKKEAEKEAQRIAKESRVKVPRGGPSVLTMIVGAVLVAMVGAVAYLFLMPIDKPAIERTLSERLGEAVTIGAAKFSPFPPQLDLSNVIIGSIKLGRVIASPDPATLITDRKIWKSVDASGVTMSADHAGKLIALALRPVPASAAAKVEIQRIKLSGVEITGMAVAMPKFDFVGLLNPAGALKQITLSLPDDKAQARLAPDANGWGVDVESRGVAWPVGPKIAWESIRARGSATANGIKFDEYTITQFGGSGRGAGELSWKDGWKFNGNIDISGVDIEALGTAFYGTSPATGALDGKFNVVLSASSAARLFDAPKIDGAFIANKAAVKNIDLARTAQSGAVAAGTTRFSDFSATLAVAGGKLQVKELKGVSGLLTVSGTAEVPADKSLGGGLTVELGVGGSRAKAIVKLSGTLAEPKLTK